jgi:hypothetical protein
MENYINPILTIILIAVYWYMSKAQNEKIKAQSGIINGLKDHLSLLDISKIKEYVELRESEKDKLMELTKQTITNATIRIIDIKGRNVLKSNVKQLDEIALDVNTLHSGMYFLNIKGDTVEINEKIIIN